VADRTDIFDFERASRGLRDLLPPETRVREVFLGQGDAEEARREILESLNSGQLLVNFLGHGSVEVWRGDLLSSADARALRNGTRLPFLVAMNCLNGFFHDVYTESLAESLLKAEGGGAVAVWASSGLTLPAEQAVMDRALLETLFAPGGATLGEATLRARASVRDRDVRRTWILFGDPATRLRH
jgi:hypothetical protein